MICRSVPVNGRWLIGPFFVHVRLSEHWELAGAIHQHPFAFGGVQVRNCVQAVVVVAKTSHKREQELHTLRSPEKTIDKRQRCDFSCTVSIKQCCVCHLCYCLYNTGNGRSHCMYIPDHHTSSVILSNLVLILCKQCKSISNIHYLLSSLKVKISLLNVWIINILWLRPMKNTAMQTAYYLNVSVMFKTRLWSTSLTFCILNLYSWGGSSITLVVL